MPKINVYLPDDLATAVRDAQVPISAVCQQALERAVRDVTALRAAVQPPTEGNPVVGIYGRFTPRAMAALHLAEEAARTIPHDAVGTEHLLLGLLDEGTNLALRVLSTLDVEVDDLRAELSASMPPPAKRVDGRLEYTPLAIEALKATATEALALGHNYIGCEHVLLGLLATEEGLASEVLRRMGVERVSTRRAIVEMLIAVVDGRQQPPPPRPEAADTMQQILQRLDAIERRLAG